MQPRKLVDLGRLGDALVHDPHAKRRQLAAGNLPATANDRGDPCFDLVPVRPPRHAGIGETGAKRLAEIGFQPDAFIERRGAARESLQCVAEEVGGGGGIVQKARSPQVQVLPKVEAEQSVVKRFRQHIEALDLRRDVEPNAFVFNVLDG